MWGENHHRAHYTPETLAETMARCVADLGRPPRVAEYDWWRRQQFELAHATRGRECALAFRKSVPVALADSGRGAAALGYSPEWIEQRLEDGVLSLEPSGGS